MVDMSYYIRFDPLYHTFTTTEPSPSLLGSEKSPSMEVLLVSICVYADLSLTSLLRCPTKIEYPRLDSLSMMNLTSVVNKETGNGLSLLTLMRM